MRSCKMATHLGLGWQEHREDVSQLTCRATSQAGAMWKQDHAAGQHMWQMPARDLYEATMSVASNCQQASARSTNPHAADVL